MACALAKYSVKKAAHASGGSVCKNNLLMNFKSARDKALITFGLKQ